MCAERIWAVHGPSLCQHGGDDGNPNTAADVRIRLKRLDGVAHLLARIAAMVTDVSGTNNSPSAAP